MVHHQCLNTGGKWEKSSIIKVLIILFGHLWKVELTYRYTFAFKFTLKSQQPLFPFPLFAIDVFDNGSKLPPVSLTPLANLPPVSTTLAKLVAKFATVVVDTTCHRCH
jgi:hypothetical protein